VHRAWLLGGRGAANAARAIEGYLMDQAQARNADIAVFGRVDVGESAPRELRWFWNRQTGLFSPEDGTLAEQPLAFFVRQAELGSGNNVFLGLPVGMGERFAVDFDNDQLRNLDEVALGTDPLVADSDGDGDPDGHEVLNGGDPLDDQVGSNDTTAPVIENLRTVYVTNRVAKIQFDTAEPTRFEATWASGSQAGTDESDLYEKTHTVLLHRLRSNQSHDVTITATDHGGNAAVFSQTGFVQTLAPTPSNAAVLTQATVTEIQDSAGTLHVQLRGRAKRKNGAGGMSGRQLRVNVIVNGDVTQEDVMGTTSGGNGFSTVDVIENGLSAGDEVRIVVITFFNVQQNTGVFWSMPDTIPEFREYRVTYTGTGL
jgi:hypothetical protein